MIVVNIIGELLEVIRLTFIVDFQNLIDLSE